ncbi:isopenicillin N synthase family oxygenase [Kineosporia sp. R_H_3]|uniref:isopenicillin N synthase family dioxygenase n=1 Tax=Kineosporia sp. R_H_3 TaxID=1961848 RepID=UPI000B4C1BA6|nr:2-oxoglutarate and iron-dependent oxygenase domain-containing protein [Kineosporia sp. R_H_3]
MTVSAEPRTLPILDLSRFRAGDAEREAFLADVRHAAHDVGFFFVTGHGVPAAVTEGVMAAAHAFFALPADAKLAIENVHSRQFRGYTRVGSEVTAGSADQREVLDVGPERPALDLGPDDPAYLGLVGPNLWPSAMPSLRPAVLDWLAEADRVMREVLRVLAAALGQPETYFDAWFDDEAWRNLKLVRYPGRDTVETDQGVGAHKDYGYLALLLQDDLGGLQVEALDGAWIDATPVPGAFVVNIGEMLEIATQGYLRATKHRVVSPPAGRDRFSVPAFLGPRLDAVVDPLTLPADLAAQARGVEAESHNVIVPHFGENTLRGWMRSHPRIVARWWDGVTPPA